MMPTVGGPAGWLAVADDEQTDEEEVIAMKHNLELSDPELKQRSRCCNPIFFTSFRTLVSSRNHLTRGQYYKHFTILIYDLRVVIWSIF